MKIKPVQLQLSKRLKSALFVLLILPGFLWANEKDIDTKIESVTIFFSGAQLNRNANIELKPGSYALVLSGIENNIDNNSIQVRGDGDYLIKSYFTRRNYLQKVDYSEEIRNLQDEFKTLVFKIEDLNIDKSVLNDEMNMILANQKLAGQEKGLDIEQLKQTSLFYQTRLKEIRVSVLKINRETADVRLQQQRVSNQISQLRSFKQTSVNQLVINVDVEKYTKGVLDISYYVPNASWSPFYEVMVDEINKPIHLVYKAKVNQTTGVDWKDADITLSTTQPNLSGQVPSLTPWYLNFQAPAPPPSVTTRGARNSPPQNIMGSGAYGTIRGTLYDGQTGETLPFATVVAKDANGNTVNGATTNVDGQYSFNVNQKVFSISFSYIGYQPQTLPINGNTINSHLYYNSQVLDEVEIAYDMNTIATEEVQFGSYNNTPSIQATKTVYKSSTLQQKATFFEYHISTPYSIPSNTTPEVVHIRDVVVDAKYEYQTVPKLDKDVFLIAQIYGWEEHHLLNGSARLYFEKTFVGESYLNVELTEDTLGLSLGRDKNIVVSRDKVLEESGQKSFSGNKKESRQFSIQIRNNKSTPIEVVVKDQYPLAKDKKITVKLEESSDAKVDEDQGFMVWKVPLEPSETGEKVFKYTVTYPSDYYIHLLE